MEKKKKTNLCRMVFGSVGSMFIFVLLVSLAGTGVGVWKVYQSISDQPIDDMAVEIKKLTTQGMLTTLENYFGETENAVSAMAYSMIYGGTPYFFDPNPQVELANALVWGNMHAILANSNSSYIWIMNAMVGPTRAVGYSFRGTDDTWSWFGTWDHNNLTHGAWQSRRNSTLVNPKTGYVDFSIPSPWEQVNGTQWPGFYLTTFASGRPRTWYTKNNPLAASVDANFPEMGILFCYIYGFVANGKNALASATITSSFVLENIRTVDVKGGVMYLADDAGYLYAVSKGKVPIYRPTGVTAYRQYNYKDYPDVDNGLIKASGDLIVGVFGSYARMPSEIKIHALNFNNAQYTVTTSTFIRPNLNLHIVTIIPESSFVGFTSEIQTQLTWVVAVIVVGAGVFSVILVVVLITIPINREIAKLNSWVNADERDPNSLFYKSTRTLIEKKYPQARDEVTEALSQRALSVVIDEEKAEAARCCGMAGRARDCVTWMGSTFAPYEVRELREASQASRNAMKSFSAYIPRSVVRTLVAQREVAKPNMVNRTLSIYFSDIEDYTGIVAAFKNDSMLVNEMINEYVGEMTVVLERNKGTVDKWIGDGIMAFWNAPLPVRNHPYWAVKASFQCERRLEYLMREWGTRGFPTVKIRHGFHLGDAYVGNVGGEGRMSFTAIGENVNVAARIESLNKRYGTYRLCTEAMYQQIAPYFLCRLMEMVAVKGTTRLIKVYEIINFIDLCTDEERARVAMYTEATEAFISGRDGFQYALSIYEQYHERYATHLEIKDVGLELMIRQCRKFVENPPSTWAGGLILEEK